MNFYLNIIEKVFNLRFMLYLQLVATEQQLKVNKHGRLSKKDKRLFLLNSICNKLLWIECVNFIIKTKDSE